MKAFIEIPVSDRTALIDKEDAVRTLRHTWYLHKSNKTHYAFANIAGQKVYLHRFIMELPHGDPREVDHRHHNGLDCRKQQLLIVSKQQNRWNTRKFEGQCLLKGVTLHPRNPPFRARIWLSKRRSKSLGYFHTAEAAHEAWLRAHAEREAA